MINNELYHYGVIGMKWGVRKSDRGEKVGRLGRWLSTSNRDEAANVLSRNKAYDDKDVAVAREYANVHKRSVVDRYSSQSTGKRVAQILLMGSQGTAYYHENRMKGNGRAKSYIKAMLARGTVTGHFTKVARDYADVKAHVDAHKQSVEAVKAAYLSQGQRRNR